MSKRKRENGDIESAEGAKHKRVKEHLENGGKPEDHQRIARTAPKAPEDAPLALSVENLSKASNGRQAKLERKTKEVGSLRINDLDGLRAISVSTVAKTLEHTRPAPETDPSDKALRRREAKLKKRRKEREQAESPRAENLAGFDVNADTTVNDSLKQSRSRKKSHKGHNEKSSTWKVSEAAGGQMLDLDPLFSQDEA